jgi:PAS domain S-box-containing protein
MAKEIQNLGVQSLLLETILEHTSSSYWDWYIKDDYEFLSPTFKKMFGYSDEEMPNHPSSWMEIIHPDDLKITLNNYKKHIKTKGEHPFYQEVRYYHKNGSIVWVICNGRVIQWDTNGDPVRIVGTHIDITLIKQLQKKVLVKKIKLEEKAIARTRELEIKNEELEQFVYIASHDLQEPLNTITSFSDLLSKNYEGKLDEIGEKSLKIIKSSSLRMRNLVRGLLDYSRIGKKNNIVIVDTNQLIRDIVEDMSEIITQTQCVLHVEELPHVRAFEESIRMLFQNLIHNAIKFRKNDTIPVIQISAIEKKTFYQFSVTDNGIGLEKQHHHEIFEIFQKLHPRNVYEGTGIGLAHCNKIVELHKGKIWVKSSKGKGSSFILTISKKI